jgi:hypothetical protein
MILALRVVPLILMTAAALASDPVGSCKKSVEEALERITQVRAERLKLPSGEYAANDAALLEARNQYFRSLGFSFTLRDDVLSGELAAYLRHDKAKRSEVDDFFDEVKKLSPDQQQGVVDRLSEIRDLHPYKAQAIQPFLDEDSKHEMTKVVDGLPLWRSVQEIQKERQKAGELLDAVTQVKKQHDENVDAYFSDVLRKRVDSVVAATDLKITNEGTIVSDPAGMPDTHTLKVAEDAFAIEKRNPDFRYMNEHEKNAVRQLAQVYSKTVDGFFTGDNAGLRANIYAEKNGMPRTDSLHGFVQKRLYTADSIWWVTGNPKLSEISEKTAIGFPRQLYEGHSFKREPFWPNKGGEVPRADLSGFRIVRNTVDDGRQSIEVFFKGQNGWEPYFYERAPGTGTWVPVQKVQLAAGNYVSVKDLCMGCHISSNGKLSPRPRMLKTEEDFQKVGYKDLALIHEMMQY